MFLLEYYKVYWQQASNRGEESEFRTEADMAEGRNEAKDRTMEAPSSHNKLSRTHHRHLRWAPRDASLLPPSLPPRLTL